MTEIRGTAKQTERILTGFWSFDRAFANRAGEIGFPVRGMCEVAGSPGIGKSTLCYFLAGVIASQYKTNIVVADIEDHLDPDFVSEIMKNAKYQGHIYNAEGDLDSEKIEALLAALRTEQYGVGILDSIGAISPVSEIEGDLEGANMGRRAMLVGKISRHSIKIGRNKETPAIVLATNHVHPMMSGRGLVSSGGVTKDYLFTTRLRLTQNERFPDGSLLINGRVDKNSFGYGKRGFRIFNLAGWGAHKGLTSVCECLWTKKAKKKSGVITMDDKSYGRFSTMMTKCDDEELFKPFIDALAKESSVPNVNSSDEDEESEE